VHFGRPALRPAALLAVAIVAGALASATGAQGAESSRLWLSRASAPPGARVVLIGHNFAPRTRFRLTLAGVPVGRGRTGRRGGFRTAFRVPVRAAGRYRLRVYSGRAVARRRFRIMPAATQPAPPVPPPAPAAPAPDPAPTVPVTTPPQPGPPSAPTLVAAGDIACRPELTETATTCHHAHTADVIDALDPDAVAALGDNQYEHGELANFRAVFDPTWGRFKPIMFPAIGNHEYEGDPERDSDSGYFEYFGSAAGEPAKGYYRWSLGDWTIFVLNSGAIDYTRTGAGSAMPDDCWPVSCATGNEQESWLRAELGSLPDDACVLAYWHHPRFSSGYGGVTRDYPETGPLYEALYEHGAELVLNGHAHNYERFEPLDPTGTVDADHGITSFVVGTGGRSLFTDPGPQRDTSETLYTDAFGVQELTLEPGGWSSRFITDAGETRDETSGTCHDPPEPVSPAP
jgi:Calcineurin-like phosphoesterase